MTPRRGDFPSSFAFREFVYGVPARGLDMVPTRRRPYPQYRLSPTRQDEFNARRGIFDPLRAVIPIKEAQ